MTEPADKPASKGSRLSSIYTTNPIRRLLLGAPLQSAHHERTLLPKILALPVFASDAISSSVYATQEILLALGVAGVGALFFTVHVSLAIGLLLIIVALSYTQTVFAYPGGGGSYIVARANLGVKMGLVGAAALLIDYIMTVATSIASGVQNLVSVPVLQYMKGHEVALCVGFIALLALANLRGLKESGTIFAIPTYCFIIGCVALIGLGLLGPAFGWQLHPVPAPPRALPATASAVGITLLLNAFARGCAALTGTEAISNGVPAFQAPQSRNAALTLWAMAIILGCLFLSISVLAVHVGVIYVDGSEPVIDQLNGVVFGKGTAVYYFIQASTVAILVLAANTSFADFPRLSAILGRDGFMPRQLANLGDKLTFSNGIVVLALLSMFLIVVFEGNTDRLIPLYAIGVFIAFTLSQAGMVVHWRRKRGRNWRVKALVNGLGAVATFLVMATIAYEKVVVDVLYNAGREFGWIILVLILILYAGFRAVEGHYKDLAQSLSMEHYQPPCMARNNTVLILTPRVHRGMMAALEYARCLSGDVRALHFALEEDTTAIKGDWERWVEDVPLVILHSPFRSVISPLLAYLNEVDHERPDSHITVLVPEIVSSRWWHTLLHANYGAWIKLYLLNRPNVVVVNFRYAPVEAG